MEKREGEAMLTDLKLFCRQMDTKAELQRKPANLLSALKTLDTATGLRQV